LPGEATATLRKMCKGFTVGKNRDVVEFSMVVGLQPDPTEAQFRPRRERDGEISFESMESLWHDSTLSRASTKSIYGCGWTD